MKFMFVSLALLLVLGEAGIGRAQGVQTGTIRGTVNDQQGLAIAGAVVTVTSPMLQGERKTETAMDGTFTLDLLPPGDYEVRYTAPDMSSVTESIAVPLGGVVERHTTLRVAGVETTVRVVAPEPFAFAAPALGLNVRQLAVERLAVQRDPVGIAQLSPAVSEKAPNNGQVVINGAFAFDNLFMLNGVDVNDNVFGNPQDLFIEDAIQETQTITSGMTAEYGRFTGGVVNAITKSGGNRFSGGLRLNLTNPSWTTETPVERANGISRDSDGNAAWEATLGGPIVADRLWFFDAGRFANTNVAGSLPVTNTANIQTTRNRRGEVKATGAIALHQTIQLGYLSNYTAVDNFASDTTADRFSLVNPIKPNWYAFAAYRGVVGSNVFVDMQFSERRFTFRDYGGTSRSIVESPFVTLTQAEVQYNAPVFDATDAEARNNRQLTENLSYLFNRAGSHHLKLGHEWFRSHDATGGSLSATDYVFLADYATGIDGSPLKDSTEHLIPQFVPFGAALIRGFPERGAALNVDTNSVFAQDHWALTPRWSADLGARFEHVHSIALPARVKGVQTSTIVPRLSAAYDVLGNSRHIARVGYGWYAGRYIRSQFKANTSVANPAVLESLYVGPPGQGRNFAPGFDLTNYVPFMGQFPAANVFLDKDLRSPTVREFSASYSFNLPRGNVAGTYVARRTVDLVEDFVDTSNGFTNVSIQGEPIGTFTNILWRNTDIAHRLYDAVVFQGRYQLSKWWTVNGHYTLQLRNDGNYEGEGPSRPGLTSQIGNYPEGFSAARSYPDGHLQAFQRHRVRLWSVYDFEAGRFGALWASGLWRADSGGVYSIVAMNQPLTAIQRAKLAAYPDPQERQTIYFGTRGSQSFRGVGVLDASINYMIPVRKATQPYIKFDVFNLFNNQTATGFNTTVVPDPNSPKDSLGLPTGYIESAQFGRADSANDFPAPYGGLTGGRSVRLALGVRF